MSTIILALVVFLEIFYYIIIIDIILSWLPLLGINIRPKFISDLIDPIYDFIKKYIPTVVGGLDFTPIVLILMIRFLRFLILSQ